MPPVLVSVTGLCLNIESWPHNNSTSSYLERPQMCRGGLVLLRPGHLHTPTEYSVQASCNDNFRAANKFARKSNHGSIATQEHSSQPGSVYATYLIFNIFYLLHDRHGGCCLLCSCLLLTSTLNRCASWVRRLQRDVLGSRPCRDVYSAGRMRLIRPECGLVQKRPLAINVHNTHQCFAITHDQ